MNKKLELIRDTKKYLGEHHAPDSILLTKESTWTPAKPAPKKPVQCAPPPVIEPKSIPQAKPKPEPLPVVRPQPTPAPPPQVKKEKTLALETPIKAHDSLDDMRRLMQRVSPEMIVHHKVPSDQKAKRIKNSWKEKESIPDIPILTYGTKHLSFLKNIAKAIEIHFAPSHIIDITSYEKEQRWDFFLGSQNLRLIIAPDTLLWGAKNLMTYYRENPEQKTRKLGDCPLLILPDLGLYFKDPFLKASLWNVLKQTLSRSS